MVNKGLLAHVRAFFGRYRHDAAKRPEAGALIKERSWMPRGGPRGIAQMSAADTAAWLGGEGEARLTDYITDPRLAERMVQQQLLMRLATVKAAEVFALACEDHSVQTADVLRDFATRLEAGDRSVLPGLVVIIGQCIDLGFGGFE